MQIVSEKNLRKLIEEGKEQGKDVSHLEKVLKSGRFTEPEKMGEVKAFPKRVILSTGPARKEDFEEIEPYRRFTPEREAEDIE